MTNKLLLILLVSFFNFIFPPIQAKNVTFATFNTFWLFDDQQPMKQWWLKQRGKNKQTYDEALTLVAKAISKTKADVIALQEIENLEVLSNLNKKLKNYNSSYKYLWISQTGDDFTGQNVALLSRHPQFKNSMVVTAYPKEIEYYLTEKDRGSERETGLSKALRVDLEIEKSVYSVFVFHLKSQSGGINADQKRLAQATIVRRITQPLISQGENVLIMGDLNADRGSPSLLRIRGFDDIYSGLYQPIYSDKFKGDKWTYKYKGRAKQLDHILISNSVKNKIRKGHINYDHSYSTSDHYPLILTLDL